MYTFEDKGGRSITLRPEGTAGVVRSYIEHGMSSLPQPVKLFIRLLPTDMKKSRKAVMGVPSVCVELWVPADPAADVEVISMLSLFLTGLV